MAFANGSEVRVASVAEVTPGTTPATPTLKVIRVTGGGLRTNKATGTSDERRADRNVSAEFMLGKDAGGSYDFELTYGSFDDWLEATLQGTWATNVLKNASIPKSFTIEETLELGATDSFHRFRGSMINGFSLDISAREKISGSFDLMSIEEVRAAAIVTGATYTPANTKEPMTASAHVAGLTVGAFPSPKIRRVSLEVTNNLRTRPVVGSVFSEVFGSGRFDCTGTIEAYFEDASIYDAVLAHATASLAFTVGSVTAEKYNFSMPKIQLGDGDRTAPGNDDDVMVTIPFRALIDTGIGATLQITPAVA